MKNFIAVIVGALVVLGSGVVHGVFTARWVPSVELERATKKVPAVPMKFGDWSGKKLETDPEEFTLAGAKAYWMRQYSRKGKDETISAVLMRGPGGRMAVHTPEVCYRGIGFDVADDPKDTTIEYGVGQVAQFKTATFRKGSSMLSENLRLYWGWSVDGTWSAPSAPRWTFGYRPALYKLYIIQKVTSESGERENKTAQGFFQELLPTLDKCLFSESSD